jgi:Beta-lactamase
METYIMFRLRRLTEHKNMLVAGMHHAVAQKTTNVHLGDRSIDVRSLNKEIKHLLEETGIPGFSLALIDSGKIVFYDTYGYREVGKRKKVNHETIFNGGSLSKTYLVYTILKLVDEQKIDLKKLAYQYLEYPRLEHDQRYKLITVEMLLTHTSGMENWAGYNDPKILEIVAEPGASYVYSGEGYHYLAMIVEKILGIPYTEYTPTMVLKPLGLNRTALTISKEGKAPKNYATNHSIFGEVMPLKIGVEARPAFGNYFTSEEYAKLVLATLDTNRLSKERVSYILNPDSIHKLEDEGMQDEVFLTSGYFLLRNKADTMLYFAGDAKGNFSYLFYSVYNKRGFVYMTNSDLGYMIGARINEITADLAINWEWALADSWQYPKMKKEIHLLNVYNDKGWKGLSAEIDRLGRMNEIEVAILQRLAEFFEEPSRQNPLLRKIIVMYPDHSWAYQSLAQNFKKSGDHKLAMEVLTAAKSTGIKDDDIDRLFIECKEFLK